MRTDNVIAVFILTVMVLLMPVACDEAIDQIDQANLQESPDPALAVQAVQERLGGPGPNVDWDPFYRFDTADKPVSTYPGMNVMEWRGGLQEVLPQYFEHVSNGYYTYANLNGIQTFSGAKTFSGAATFSGTTTLTGTTALTGTVTSTGASVTLGDTYSDTVTVNGALKTVIYRDDFCGIGCIQNDFTACSGTDTEINFIKTSVNPFGYYQFVEQTATLQLALPLLTGVCGLDVSGDITANDGQEIKFGHEVLDSVHIVQAADTAATFYFDISITITDISAFDGDWATGLMMPEAQQNPPQHDGLNTYFIATLSDNAGDLDFEADVDGGGAAADDAGITWADGETKVLHFEIDTDGYAAAVDGVAITLTNCNTSNDFTDLDRVLPFYYHTQGAEGAATGVIINYVEWGYTGS